MAAYRRVYDSHHLQADCQEPGSAVIEHGLLLPFIYIYLPHTHTFISARRYASAVLAIALCLPVCVRLCPSVTSRSSVETGERIELISGIFIHVHRTTTAKPSTCLTPGIY